MTAARRLSTRDRTLTVCIAALCATLSSGCARSPASIEYESGFTPLSSSERDELASIAGETVGEIRKLLPGAPERVVVRLRVGADVIPETGETATTIPPNIVVVTVDPSHPGGSMGVLRAHLRATLFHEVHHLVRDRAVPRVSLLDTIVSEGMASAFERDAAGTTPPWTAYPQNVDAWTQEVLALPPDVDRRPWLFEHPDGRRWVGFKVGTHLVDCAMKRTGHSAADLATTPTDVIVGHAETCPAP